MGMFLTDVFSNFWKFLGFFLCLVVVVEGVVKVVGSISAFLSILFRGYNKPNNYYYLGSENGFKRVELKDVAPKVDNENA